MKGPERLGPALSRALAGLGLAEAAERHMALAVWPRVVGEGLAAHTRAVAVRGRTLEVAARDSAWANELAFLKADLLSRLHSLVPGCDLDDIRVRVGSLEPLEPGARATPAPAPASAQPASLRRTRARLRRLWPHLAKLDAPLARSFLAAAARALCDEEGR